MDKSYYQVPSPSGGFVPSPAAMQPSPKGGGPRSVPSGMWTAHFIVAQKAQKAQIAKVCLYVSGLIAPPSEEDANAYFEEIKQLQVCTLLLNLSS